jgi:NADPH2:quinone reductase
MVHTPGGPEALQIADVPNPIPRQGEVLVRAHAIGVGRPDVLVRRGTYRWMPPLPVILGNELAGSVEAVGPNVADTNIGKRVLVMARDQEQRGGCYAEYIAVPADRVHFLPDSIDFEAAVCLPNYQLAWALLHTTTGRPAESVLIIGAAGGVGSALVQLAKCAGMTVIGTISSPEKARFAMSLGADHTINYRTESVSERVRALTGGRGVDLILDHICGPAFTDHLTVLARFGTLVSFSVFGGLPEKDVFREMLANSKNCPAVRCFSIHAFDHDPVERGRMFNIVEEMVASEAICPVVSTRVPLAEARRAHELLEQGQTLGKIILVP